MSFVQWRGTVRALDGDIRLDGKDIDLVVGGALASFDEELSVDGSAIVRLGIVDPYCEVERSGLLDLDGDDDDRLGREVELVVDRVAYWLRQVNRSPESDVIELTFEDREICRLRDTTGRLKVSARSIDDRSFIRRLCAKAGTVDPIVDTPGDSERQVREAAGIGKTKLRVEAEQQDRARRKKPGLARDLNLTVKGSRATQAQLLIAARLLSVAHEMGAGPKATLALVLAAIVESVMSNPRGGDGNSYGVLQAWVGRSRGARGTITTIEEAMDVEYMAESFLIDKRGYGFTSAGGAMYLERTTSMSAAQIAQAVEGSGYPDRYGLYEAEGRAFVESFTGGDLPLTSGRRLEFTTTYEQDLVVEAGESYWDAARRTADAYNARFFVIANQPYYVRDDALMRSAPALTVANPRHPGADPRRARGVLGVGWEWAPRAQLRRTDLVVNVRERHAPPGSVVLLDDTCGPAGFAADRSPNRGRWLIGRYERSRFEPTATITLIKGRRPRVPVEVDTKSESIQPLDSVGGKLRSLNGKVRITTEGGAKGIVEQIALLAEEVGGTGVYVGSDYRSGSTTTSGNVSDHASNDASRAARDIGVRGIDLLVGPPSPKLDKAAAAIGEVFGRDYGSGAKTIVDTFEWKGYRLQIIWRTPAYGGHMGHIHAGARRL